MDSENTEPPVAIEQLIGFLAMSAMWFDWLFDEYPFFVNVLSASLLLSIGNLIVQTIVLYMGDQRQGQSSGYNMTRNYHTMIIGCIFGLFDHLWYEGLDHYIRGSSFNVVIKKVLLDQFVARPFFSSAFIVGMSILDGLPTYFVYKQWKDTFPTKYKADWKMWPAAQLVNFFLLPAKYRVVYVNGVKLLWNSYLSYKKYDHAQGEVDSRENSFQCLRSEVQNNTIFPASNQQQRSSMPACSLEPQVSLQSRSARNVTSNSHKTTPSRLKIAGSRLPPKAVKRKKIFSKKKSGALVKKQAAAPNTDLKENACNKELQNKLTDICESVQYLTNTVNNSQRSLEMAIRETREEVDKLGQAQADVMSVLEETKLGLVSVAKQIVAVVRVEGQKGSEVIAKYVEDVVNKFDLKMQSLRHPEGTFVGQTGTSQGTAKQFSFL